MCKADANGATKMLLPNSILGQNGYLFTGHTCPAKETEVLLFVKPSTGEVVVEKIAGYVNDLRVERKVDNPKKALE